MKNWALCMLLISGVSAAEVVEEKAPLNARTGYLGVSAGGADLTTNTYHDRSDQPGFGIYGGYRFLKYLAVEGQIQNLGQFDPENSSRVSYFRMSSFNACAVGLIPVTERFDLFAKLGFGLYFQENKLAAEESQLWKNDLGMGYVGGLGMQYRVFDKLSMRLGLTNHYVFITDSGRDNNRVRNITEWSLGLHYHF